MATTVDTEGPARLLWAPPPMYRIHRSIDISFTHQIRGHAGACINLHGHTWKLEVGLQAAELDAQGFVADFSLLSARVLRPCFELLDHALAIGAQTFAETEAELAQLGARLVASRDALHGPRDWPTPAATTLGGAQNHFPGGMKLAVFPFSPTSERLAEWLYRLAEDALADDRVSIAYARVYETLHPVESVAEFTPD